MGFVVASVPEFAEVGVSQGACLNKVLDKFKKVAIEVSFLILKVQQSCEFLK